MESSSARLSGPFQPVLDEDWKEILEFCRAKLTAEDFRVVSHSGTLEGLQLGAFNSAFDVLVHVDPQLTAPIWGSIRLSVDLVKSTHDVFDMIGEMFHEIDETLPRLGLYKKVFEKNDENSHLHQSCRNVNMHIAEFCCLVIRFYRSHPLRNLMLVTWNPFRPQFDRVIHHIKQATRHIELEAQALAIQDSYSRHEEIRRLVTVPPPPTLELKIPCHYIGQLQTPYFTGRTDMLTKIDGALRPSTHSDKQRIYCLHGLGGVGKTQLAASYVQEHLDDFSVIFWIVADTETQIMSEIRAAITKLGLKAPGAKDDDRAVASCFQDWLQETDESWLLIFDNVDDPTHLKKIWPHTNRGAVLLTSRSLNIIRSLAQYGDSSGAQVLSLTDDEGADLITKMIRYDARELVEAGEDWELVDSRNLACSLSRELGGLPLAIVQMSNFMIESGCSLPDFMQILSSFQERSELIIESDHGVNMSYSLTLTTTWDVSISRVSQNGKHLLDLLSFFHNDSIPESIFTSPLSKETLQEYPSLSYLQSKIKWMAAKKSVFGYSLVTKGPIPDTFAVHRLVSEITLAKLTPNDQQKRFNEAVELIYRVYPSLSPEETFLNKHWDKLRLYLPHVLSLERQFRESGTLEPTSKFAIILMNACWFLFEQNSLDQVTQLLPTLRTAMIANRTGNEFFLAQRYRLNAIILLDTREYRAASDFALKSLEVLKAIAHLDPFLPADGYNLVAFCQVGMRDYEAAEENFNRSLAIRQRFLDRNPAMRGFNIANLSLLYNLTKQYSKAKEFAARGLELVESQLGVGSFKTAEIHSQIGNASIGLGDLDLALSEHTRAMNIRLDAFGSGYKLAASFHKVAWILNERKDYQGAETLLQRALQIYNTGYKTRGELGRSSYLMSTVLENMGRKDDATNAKTLAGEIRKEVLGLEPNEDDNQESYDLLIPFEQR